MSANIPEFIKHIRAGYTDRGMNVKDPSRCYDSVPSEDRCRFDKVGENSYYRKSLVNYIARQLNGASVGEIHKIIDSYKSYNDLYTMRMICKLRKKPTADRRDRAGERVAKILEMVRAYRDDPTTVLDFGCGNGEITAALAKTLELPAENIHGIDIGPREIPGVTYHHEGNPIAEFPDEKFDLIIAMVVFHHLDNPGEVMAHMFRVMKSGGLLVFREHDFTGGVQGPFLDLVHMFTDVLDHPDGDYPEDVQNGARYHINYAPHSHWKSLLTKAGFVELAMAPYDGNNPQSLYHAVYKKP